MITETQFERGGNAMSHKKGIGRCGLHMRVKMNYQRKQSEQPEKYIIERNEPP